MNISVSVIPYENGFQYTYILPLHGDNQSNVRAIFGSNFDSPNLFRPVGVDEFVFTGKIIYSPNNLQAFRFYSDQGPVNGSIILRGGGVDTSVNAAIPAPESGALLLIPLLAGIIRRRRHREAATEAGCGR